MTTQERYYDTIVIGGGQAGLVTGYYLKQKECNFVILEASERIGDCWRKRWDSLELFTAAQYDRLPGLAFPAPDHHYPSKDEMANYLETYAKHFELPVELGIEVEHVRRDGDIYVIQAMDDEELTARNIVIAIGAHPSSYIPQFAQELDSSIQQLHSSNYQNPQQLPDGDVLVVGAGSSGTQIALDIVPYRKVKLAGHYTGFIPRFFLRIDVFGVLIRTVFNFSVDTWLGRKIAQVMTSRGAPVVDIREAKVKQAGVIRVPRVTEAHDGKPVLEDGQILDSDVIIWATGFSHDYRWIELPIFDKHGMPRHYRGVVEDEPGIYFIGLPSMYRGKSPLVCGVSDDAKYIVDKLVARFEPSVSEPHEATTIKSQSL